MSITEELANNFSRFCIEYSAIPNPVDKALERRAKDSPPDPVAKLENAHQLRMKFLTNFLRFQGEIQSWKSVRSGVGQSNPDISGLAVELAQVVTPGTIR